MQEARASKTREGKRTSTSRMALKAMGKGRMWRKENVSEAPKWARISSTQSAHVFFTLPNTHCASSAMD
jgi:hypothetical protein